MNTLRIFPILFFFLVSGMPGPSFWGNSPVGAEEVMQLARLRPRVNFVRNDRLREQIRENKRKERINRVFVSPRGLSRR